LENVDESNVSENFHQQRKMEHDYLCIIPEKHDCITYEYIVRFLRV